MSYIKLQSENFDSFSLTLRPRYEFSSSSAGITGSVKLVERPSASNRSFAASNSTLTFDAAKDYRFEEIFRTIKSTNNLTDQNNKVDSYVKKAGDLFEIGRNNVVIPITRLTQSIDFSTSSNVKSNVKNILFRQYRSIFTDSNYNYKNYHSINFFTSSTVPSNSAIIYPNRIGGTATNAGSEPRFDISSSFSIDFYINPRYLAESTEEFNAGTILHFSSSFCLSLLTGSHRNENNQVDSFRLALGLAKSADVKPNLIDTGVANGTRTGDQQFLFVSDDNILKYNNWHHVTVSWGDTATSRTGSFNIDGRKSTFIYDRSTIRKTTTSTEDDVVYLGNFCDIASNESRKFFNTDAAQNEGLIAITGAGGSDPTIFSFTNPLNAELHDVKIFNRVISSSEIDAYSRTGPSTSVKNLVFYVPGLFTNQYTQSQLDFLTPISRGTVLPITPFNVNLAHATQVFSPNLQNFLFDVSSYTKMGTKKLTKTIQFEASPVAPRLYNLSAAVNTSINDEFASDHMLRDQNFAKRILTILPCDNGLFLPNYAWCQTQNTSTKYRSLNDDIGNEDITSISLLKTDVNTNIGSSLGMQTVDLLERKRSGSTYVYSRKFPRPNFYTVNFNLSTNDTIRDAGNITTLLSFSGSISARTKGYQNDTFADDSSNLSSFYVYSNLYYGNQIFPGSLSLSTTNLTGSGGKINITLKDNGAGGLYRDDCLTPAATWATVGNVFYDQGISVIKSPHLYYFGKDNFSTSFNGSQNLHTYTIDAICPAGEINSSSNPSYLSFPPTDEQNETAVNFVYITGINIHDDNFNVIMRANLAQPVLKRPDEEFLFRLKYDY